MHKHQMIPHLGKEMRKFPRQCTCEPLTVQLLYHKRWKMKYHITLCLVSFIHDPTAHHRRFRCGVRTDKKRQGIRWTVPGVQGRRRPFPRPGRRQRPGFRLPVLHGTAATIRTTKTPRKYGNCCAVARTTRMTPERPKTRHSAAHRHGKNSRHQSRAGCPTVRLTRGMTTMTKNGELVFVVIRHDWPSKAKTFSQWIPTEKADSWLPTAPVGPTPYVWFAGYW